MKSNSLFLGILQEWLQFESITLMRWHSCYKLLHVMMNIKEVAEVEGSLRHCRIVHWTEQRSNILDTVLTWYLAPTKVITNSHLGWVSFQLINGREDGVQAGQSDDIIEFANADGGCYRPGRNTGNAAINTFSAGPIFLTGWRTFRQMVNFTIFTICVCTN